MEAIIVILVVLAYCFCLKLIDYAISRKITSKEDMRGENMGGLNKFEHIPAIKLVFQKPSDFTHPESGETITLLFTDRESFHKEWEIINDDAERPTPPPGKKHS